MQNELTPEKILSLLDLRPHPEGGYYSRTYQADEQISLQDLPERYSGSRVHSTAIYYLLTSETCSRLHRIHSDEVFHFYLGNAVEMLHLFPDGTGRCVMLGTDLLAGTRPQVVVPRGVWQGARIADGGTFALLGCTVAPGFDYDDFELGDRASLLADYPQFSEEIHALT
jgi:hypothetical protein